MRIVIFGSNGQIGRACAQRLADVGTVVALDRQAVDICDRSRVADAIGAHRPDLVINAAAYTAVDRAEQEPEPAFRVNGRAPGELARCCELGGAALIHLSTDYVFDGTKHGPYVETDPPAPLGVYGRSKLDGERAVLGSGCAAIVLRTAWVYGEHGDNFITRILRLAAERDALQVVADQRGAPTWAKRVADVLRRMVVDASDGDCRADPVGWFGRRRGLYHLSAAGETTRHAYAMHVVATAIDALPPERRPRLVPDRIEPVPSSARPTPAARPLNSMLDCTKLRDTFGCELPDWRDDVTAFVRRVAAGSMPLPGTPPGVRPLPTSRPAR